MLHVALLGMLQTTALAAPTPPVPFAVGETFEYTGKWGLLHVTVAHARLAVEAVDTTRGVPTWRFSFRGHAAFLLFASNDTLTSWTRIDPFESLRFEKRVNDTGFHRYDNFSIHPDSGTFINVGDSAPRPTSPRPLDDVAFFYYLRTVPLEVDSTYRFNRYFDASKNPVVVHVIGRAICDLPDHRTMCLVLHPLVDEPHGMFNKDADARIWYTDDALRIPVAIETHMGGGTVRLTLSKIIEPPRHRP